MRSRRPRAGLAPSGSVHGIVARMHRPWPQLHRGQTTNCRYRSINSAVTRCRHLDVESRAKAHESTEHVARDGYRKTATDKDVAARRPVVRPRNLARVAL